jgi:Zn-dependent M28 family amino/carboxypeptidase
MLNRTTIRLLTGVQVVVLLAAAAAYLARPPLRPHPDTDARLAAVLAEVNTDSLLYTVHALANQRTRRYGSPGATAAASFIAGELQRFGYAVERQEVATEGRDAAVVTNVLCDLGPRRERPPLLLCAHYDSRGEHGNDIAPGADDNASGVAVLLEVARALSLHEEQANVRLAFFGGEEDDFIGSRAYVNEATDLPRAVINVDMVGYDEYGPMDVVVFTNRHSAGLVDAVREAARHTPLRLAVTFSEDGNSDHDPFWRAGVPAVSIWEGYDHHPYYHTTQDIPARLTPVFMTEAARLVAAVAFQLGAVGGGEDEAGSRDRLTRTRGGSSSGHD